MEFEYSGTEQYEIGTPLGRGKYSEVFDGFDAKNNSRIVIKLLKPVWGEKIKREISILKNLKGGNRVIELVDICKDT